MSKKGPKQEPAFDPTQFSAHDAISEAVRLRHDDTKIIAMLREHFNNDIEGVSETLLKTMIDERRTRLGIHLQKDPE